jgi:inhibitor of cysteine peptidase
MAGKKTFLFIFFLLVLAMGVNMAVNETSKNKPVIFTASEEAETHITVAGAGEFAIKIKSNPTTGYSWSLQKPLDETMVKFKRVETEKREAEKPPKLGAPTYEILTFEALEPGETVIYLQYRRPWEKNVPPVKSHKIVVTIK